MRVLPAILAALTVAVVLGLTGPAAAQVAQPSLRLAGADPAEPLVPLGAPSVVPLDVEVDCALLVGPASPITLRVTQAPAWVIPTVAPAEMALDVTRCEGGIVRSNASLLLQAETDAPAFTPETVTVRASLPHVSGERVSEVPILVRVGYFSIIDAAAETPIATGAPGAELVFPVRLSNLGNAPTRFILTAADNGGLQILPPLPVVIETGGEATAAVTAYVPAGGGFVNEVRSFTLAITSAYALDGAQTGDATTLSFLVTMEGFDAPIAWLAGLAALALGAGARRRP